MRRLFLFLLFVVITLQAYTQITIKQADEMIFEYIDKEITWPYHLYSNDNLPEREDGTAVFSWYGNNAEDSLKIMYPCWIYCIDEVDVNGPHAVLFLVVKKKNGSLLEIKHRQAFSMHLEEWRFVLPYETATEHVISDFVSHSLTGDILKISSADSNIDHIVIHDMAGKKVFEDSYRNIEVSQSNISSIKQGLYVLSIYNKKGLVGSYKLMKKQ